MIKSVGQTFGYGAVKGYVNRSVPLHFCHAWRSLSTGILFLSCDARKLDIGRLDTNMQMCRSNVCLNYLQRKFHKPQKDIRNSPRYTNAQF